MRWRIPKLRWEILLVAWFGVSGAFGAALGNKSQAVQSVPVSHRAASAPISSSEPLYAPAWPRSLSLVNVTMLGTWLCPEGSEGVRDPQKAPKGSVYSVPGVWNNVHRPLPPSNLLQPPMPKANGETTPQWQETVNPSRVERSGYWIVMGLVPIAVTPLTLVSMSSPTHGSNMQLAPGLNISYPLAPRATLCFVTPKSSPSKHEQLSSLNECEGDIGNFWTPQTGPKKSTKNWLADCSKKSEGRKFSNIGFANVSTSWKRLLRTSEPPREPESTPEPTPTPDPTPEPTPEPAPEPEPASSGEQRSVSSTAYCLTGTMANGEKAHDGAVAMNGVPFGTRYRTLSGTQAGRVLTVKDRIGHGSQFDIAMPGRCQDARNYGRQQISVERLS